MPNKLKKKRSIGSTIATRNGKAILKHRSNWPFYALMLRTKLYQNPFFFTVHQNVNKLQTVYGAV